MKENGDEGIGDDVPISPIGIPISASFIAGSVIYAVSCPRCDVSFFFQSWLFKFIFRNFSKVFGQPKFLSTFSVLSISSGEMVCQEKG